MRARYRPMAFGFSLIELLVVISIIAMLAGMVMAGLNASNTRARIVQTEQLLSIVGQAVESFRLQTGYPPVPTGSRDTPLPALAGDPDDLASEKDFASWYPDSAETVWERQALWWRLATPMTEARRLAARDRAQEKRAYIDPVVTRPAAQTLWRDYKDAATSWRTDGYYLSDTVAADIDLSVITNEEAEEYRMEGTKAWHWGSGDDWRDQSGGKAPTLQGWVKVDLLRIRGIRESRNVESAWVTADVLETGDVSSSMRDEDTILDVWGQPLAYIHSYQPPVSGRIFGHHAHQDDPPITRPTDHPAIGRLILTDRNGDGMVDVRDLAEEPPVAERIDHNDDGTIDEYDWGSWLWYALPGNEFGYLLMSGGPSGEMDLRANEPANRDNVLYRGGD